MKYFAYVKYVGEDIHDGVFGAKASAAALLGLDAALRYYAEQEIPELKDVEYDFPIKIQEGSWEALVPENVEELMQVVKVGGLGALVAVSVKQYLKKTAEIAAKDGLLETGLAKDIEKAIRKSVEILQWVVSYVKHMRSFDREPKATFDADNDSVTVYNKEGKALTFPQKYLGFILHCPKSILNGLARNITEKRTLKLGLRHGSDWSVAEIGNEDRGLFYEELEEEDVLPELKHGELVVLHGVIVRANEKEQSFGLQYKDHIITCKPEEGRTIGSFKDEIISSRSGKLYQTHVKVTGVVDRLTEDGRHKIKPRLFVSEVQAAMDENGEPIQDEIL